MSSETPTLLENGRHGERALHLPCFSLEVGCCRLFGDLYFNLVNVCMLFTMNGCMCMVQMYVHAYEGVHTLRIGLGHYMMGGFLPGLKSVSCCPSDHPREGNIGAQ